MQNIHMVLFGSQQVEQEITRLLSPPSGIKLAASTDNASALFPLLEQIRPALLLLETEHNHTATLSLVQTIRTQYPRMKLLLLLHNIDAAQVREFIRVGVSGCVLLGSSLEELETDIHLVQNGKLILSSEITQALLAS